MTGETAEGGDDELIDELPTCKGSRTTGAGAGASTDALMASALSRLASLSLGRLLLWLRPVAPAAAAAGTVLLDESPALAVLCASKL